MESIGVEGVIRNKFNPKLKIKKDMVRLTISFFSDLVRPAGFEFEVSTSEFLNLLILL